MFGYYNPLYYLCVIKLKNTDMTTLELIYHICTHPEYTTVVINGEDKTPIQAIELLSSQSLPDSFTLNGSLEKNTLIVYDFTLANLAPNH